MIQDKFLDSYIEDVYSIGEEKNNIFLFRGNKNESVYVTTKREIEFIGNDKIEIKKRLMKIKSTDSIFVHWYDMWISEIVFDLPNKIYVMLWGGEFFCEPFWHHQWVYDTITLRNLKINLGYPTIKFTFQPLNLLRQLKRMYFFKKELKQAYQLKNKYIGRIDYLISLEKNDSFFQDYHKIKALYPAFKAKNVVGFYDQNFDRALLIKESKKKQTDNISILLGNSANVANNHFDAFEVLRTLKNVTILCPLSYGANKTEVDAIIAKGKQIFNERFVPITEYMTRDEYVGFLNTVDIVFMYHNRQQAFGNICTGLSLGKPVFLKKTNSVKGYLDAMGILTYDVDTITNLKLYEIISQSKANLLKNIELLRANISTEKRLSYLKQVLKINS